MVKWHWVSLRGQRMDFRKETEIKVHIHTKHDYHGVLCVLFNIVWNLYFFVGIEFRLFYWVLYVDTQEGWHRDHLSGSVRPYIVRMKPRT